MATISYNNSSNRVGQIIYVPDFIPTKFAAYLRRTGKNYRNYFLIDDYAVIDSTNFSEINYGTNKIYMDDVDSGFTGNGYMKHYNNFSSSNSIIVYPIAAENSTKNDIWLKLRNEDLTYDIDIYLDDDKVVSEAGALAAGWQWVSFGVLFPDNKQYNLGISLKDNNLCIDKIYIGINLNDPNISEPDMTLSPFVTAHFQIYNVDDLFIPTNKLDIYDYKNTINHIRLDDWQNFLINNLNVNNSEKFNKNYYAAVLSTSGGSKDNMISWDVIDAIYDPYDPYNILPSVFKTI